MYKINVLKIEKYAGIINLVGDEKISIKELISEIITISGMNSKIELVEKTSPNRDLVFENSKMRDLLCMPKVGLKEGLIIEWNYMKNLSK